MKQKLKIILIPFLLVTSGCSYQGNLAPDDSDPYEKSNRGFFEFNEKLDEAILEPVADTYDVVVPEVAQTRFINFIKNAESPINIVNLFLQGRPLDSLESLLNFSINSTIGILGIFDPASKMGLKTYDEDFGQTLGIWGFEEGSYWMTPVLGPYTTRHTVGDLIDNLFNPLTYIDNGASRYGIKIFDKIQERSDLSPLEDELYGSYDPYQYLRDSYLDNRKYKLKNGQVDEVEDFNEIDFEDF
ncbi:MAG TPA: VacJ family lipoprotein [Gammaproteobacteria bacterium]|jgi:phospholipid-binding lipoprotein MlaA|nr:VacJ family lipoprotein [Gammaproteobacteria bacterium]